MCVSNSSVKSAALNPNAQEWIPPPKPPIYSPPLPVVALAPPPPPKHPLPFFCQGFIPYGVHPPPPTVLYEVAPPPMVEKPVIRFFKRNTGPRMWRCASRLSTTGADHQNIASRRMEWRPRGGAAPSPPRGSAAPFVKLSKTTVMIKNIPNQLRRDYMLAFLDTHSKEQCLEYDFFYLPMDFGKENNLGYAFVNMTSSEGALKLKKVLENYEWGTMTTKRGGSYTSQKVCQTKWATIQGLEGMLRRFENSVFACDKKEFLPVKFDPPRNGSNSDVARPVSIGALRASA